MLSCVLVLLALLSAASGPAEEADSGPVILVMLTGFSSLDGMARIAVFDSEDFWPEEVEFSAKRVSSAVSADTVLLTIADIAPGSYALAAFHDEDADSVFDRGLFGVPSESYGFSNNVRGRTGPPDFEDALVVLSADTVYLEIELK